MFLPISTDRRLRRTPWVNGGLVVVNTLIYLITRSHLDDPAVETWFLHAGSPRLAQFITYAFLHASGMHLLGNMIFLFVFGNNVEDRLGHVGYLAYYLAGAVLAGLGHALVETSPVLGASGAVAAVSGAYLALFPRSRVTLIYFFIIIGEYEVSSGIVILFYFGYDIIRYLVSESSVAYVAHITGYLFGFSVGITLLLTHLLPREPYDVLSLFEHRRRRRVFTNLTQQGYAPWELNRPPEPVPAVAEKRKPVVAVDNRRAVMRARVSGLLAENRLPAAADEYAKLIDLDGSQVMPRQQQLDLANQLMGEGRHLLAARAYELFLTTFRTDNQRDQVELILGLAYIRYLDRKQRGRELLTTALTRLHDPDQIAMARHALDQLDR